MRVELKRHRPLCWIDNESFITYSNNKIYKYNTNSKQLEFICDIPMKSIFRLFSRLRIFERLLRTEVKTAVQLNDSNIIFTRGGALYRVNIQTKELVCEHHFRKDMNNPYYLTKIEGVKGFEDSVVYGEYVGRSTERFAVSIYQRELKVDTWEKVFTFLPGQVRHVHGIIPDTSSGCVYVLTGDTDEESAIWVTKDNFKTLEPILINNQRYRSVFLFPIGNNEFVYATDTALQQNYIYHGLQNSDTREWQVIQIKDIDGSCLSASCDNNNIYFSTTVENDERRTGLITWIDYRRSPGIKSEYAQIIKLNKEFMTTNVIFSLKKDIFPCRLLQYGFFVIVPTPNEKGLYIYPIGLKKYDGKMLFLEKGIDYK